MRKLLAALIFAATLVAGITPAIAQAPPAVPALPDTERRTAYTISAQTGPFNVSMAIFGDGTDYSNWVEVWLNGVRLTPVTQWTLALTSGTLATAARPLTNAQVTLVAAGTGDLQIVGARRPRRASQFNENLGVTARALNQVITDLVAQNRETWDKINDVTGRAIVAPPGESLTVLPKATTRAGLYLCFDGSGGATLCTGGASLGGMTGVVTCGSGLTCAAGMISATGGAPGGSTTQLQYNAAGSFGGITGATTNGTTLTLVAPVLGTPASVTLTNATGLPLATGVTGNLLVGNLNSGSSASASTFWRGDGTWATPSGGSGNVTSSVTLTANRLVLGNGTTDLIVMGSLGTTTTVLHGNAAGPPTFAAVVSADLNITTTTCSASNFVSAISAGAVGTCSPLGVAGVANGGTGSATLTNHGVLVGAGTSAITQLPAAVAGTLLAGLGVGSDPAFTATPTLGAIGTTLGSLAFAGNTSGTVTISVNAVAGTYTFKLPNSAGTSGQTLSTDGVGNLSWVAPSGTVISGTAGQLVWYSATGTTVRGNANANMVNGALTLGQSGQVGQLIVVGNTSGSITITPQAVAGTYNFNLPIGAGTSGQPLLSGGGSSTPMSYGTLSGNTTAFVTTSGTQTSGRCVVIDASGNHVADSGGCGGGILPLSVIGQATNVDVNATGDTAIPIALPSGSTKFRVLTINIVNRGTTASLTTARAGIFTATGGAGIAIAADQALSALTSNANDTAGSVTGLSSSVSTVKLTASTVYFRVGTAQGAAAAVDVSITAYPLP